jgi:hypothetical protein
MTDREVRMEEARMWVLLGSMGLVVGVVLVVWALYLLAKEGFLDRPRYDLKLWTAAPHESATYPPA